MKKKESIYISLDEAREEIAKRWKDEDLKKKIEEELGDKFMKNLFSEPRGVYFHQVCSPDNGFMFFYQCAKYAGTLPLGMEYLGDIFVHFNEDKKAMGRLRVVLENKEKALLDIMDFHANEKKTLGDVMLINGERMVDFHHHLFEKFDFEVDLFDNTDWFHKFKNAQDYYYFLLLHFVAHGVLFEVFQLEEGADEKESFFSREIILPAIKIIHDKFGAEPLIVRIYPENQTKDEDFYWWSYPCFINSYLIKFAKDNNFLFKKNK